MKIKSYSLEHMKDRDVANLMCVINELGFGPGDFRVIHFGSHSSELKIMNKELHWKLKSMSKLQRMKSDNKRS